MTSAAVQNFVTPHFKVINFVTPLLAVALFYDPLISNIYVHHTTNIFQKGAKVK